MRLTKKLLYLDRLLLPINLMVIFTYRFPFIYCLRKYFSYQLGTHIYLFIRQGVTQTPRSFNFIFSDLDIGIIATEVQVKKIKTHYYNIKKILIFLGEVEIYTQEEMNEFNETKSELFNLYTNLRKVRQLHWLRNRVLSYKLSNNQKNRYHLLKDVRKIFILLNSMNLKSAQNTILFTHEVLLKYVKPKHVFEMPEGLINQTLYCDYLSKEICIKNENQSQLLFILSCLPTYDRNNHLINNLVVAFRIENPEIEQVFRQLNRLEYIIAKAYIRGCKNEEDWHQRWISQIEMGFKNNNEFHSDHIKYYIPTQIGNF